MARKAKPKGPEDDTIQVHIEVDSWVPIEELMTMHHPFNSQETDEHEIGALMRNIKANGFTGEPIEVNKWNNKIVSGHQRTQACWNLGFRGNLPVVWRDYPSDAQHRMEMLARNKSRGHQNVELEQAEIVYILNETTDTPDEVEEALALAPGTVEDWLEDIDEFADDQARDGSGEPNKRIPFDKDYKVRVVVKVTDLIDFEKAITMTGIANRGDALIEICRSYAGAEVDITDAFKG